jgi:hypothetical protein
MGSPTEASRDYTEVAEETEPVTRNYQAEYMNPDDDPDDANEDEGLFGFVESEAMKAQATQQLEDAIKLIPQDAKAAYLKALERAPTLVATESDPMRFLHFEKFNAWAAARRLVTYWSSRVAIFGEEKAFLPLDLTGNGALDEEDLDFLNSGCVVTLPNDSKNRSVICIDRSNKIHGADDMCIRPLFFLLSAASENEMSQKDGCIVLVVLNSPTGATFHAGNVSQATELVRKALPLRLKKSHLLCCPPKPGASKFTETFIPMALQRLGKFVSRDAGVHVANTEAGLLEKLLPYGLAREGLPSSVGGTFVFDKYVVWLEQRGLIVKEKAARFEESQWDQSAIIRQTLANYSAQVAETERSSENRDRAGLGIREDDDRKMAARPNAGANTEFLGYGEQGLSAAEKDEILCDIYGSADVPFTITEEIQKEGRARARLEEALDLIPDENKYAYLEARERAPHLVELESDPRRYLRSDGMDPWAAAKHLCTYWEKRKEIFGEKAFLPMTLDGKGALSLNCIELIKCGFFAILPNDKKGRVALLHNRFFLNDRLVSHGAQDRIRCGFYIFSLMAEREESQLHGFIGTAVYGDNDTSLTYSREFVKVMVSLLECGAMPFKLKAIHFVYPSQKNTFLHSLLSRTLNIVGSWDFMEKRTVVHSFDKVIDLMEDLEKYGFEKDKTPEYLGGNWKYEYFTQMLEERARNEKSLYGGGDYDSDSKPDSSERSSKKRKVDGDDAALKEKERRAKKRKMDALYARRKRERQRIEVEVLEDQCKELGEKNRSLDSDNKRLETILKEAKGQVERYESSQSQVMQGTTQVSSTGGGGSSQQSVLEQLLQDPNLRGLLQQATNGNVARGSRPIAAPGPSHYANGYQGAFSHQSGMPASASLQYPPSNVASIGAQTHMQGNVASGQQSLPNETSNQYSSSIAASLALQSLLQGSLMKGYQPQQQDTSGHLPSAPRAEVPAPPAANILELLALLRSTSAANPHQN